MKSEFLVLFIYLIFVIPLSAQEKNKYDVFEGKSDTLQKVYFLNRLHTQFELRREKVKETLKSKEKIYLRQKELKNWYKHVIGKLPDRTPLKSIITKRKEFKKYIIEWIAFESVPNHHVTGMFYLPKNMQPPLPAVYIPCGHSILGKGGETYQKAARLFALNGFVVLVGDPIDQGERFQYLDKEGKPVTEERMLMHEILGEKLMLTGSNSLIHELWDNVRCLDFLEQQSMVDKSKIAIAGNSGGGTQVTYLAAFDDRVKVAIPSCYIATTEKVLNTRGSQDGCQQLWGEGKVGVEQQDFLLMAAPKPILISSATHDFFKIEGARAAYHELKKEYTVLGVPEKVEQVVAEGEHGWHKPLREAAVQWCRKWLLNDNSPITEPEDIGFFEDEKELWVTKTGQVLTSFADELSVSDITRIRLKDCKANREKFLNGKNKAEVIKDVKKIIGFEELADNPKYKLIGNFNEDNYEVKKYLIERDPEYKFNLPALLFTPENNEEKSSIVIVVSEFGKFNELKQHSRIQDELAKGNRVLALDVCNTGELKDKKERQYNNKEFWMGKLALYEGKTLMTYRVEDILLAKSFLEKNILSDSEDINIISVGLTGPAALHAAFIDGGFNYVYIINSIKSWEEVASANYTANQIANIVPGVLNFYDLPDLIRLMPHKVIKLIDPVDAENRLL